MYDYNDKLTSKHYSIVGTIAIVSIIVLILFCIKEGFGQTRIFPTGFTEKDSINTGDWIMIADSTEGNQPKVIEGRVLWAEFLNAGGDTMTGSLELPSGGAASLPTLKIGSSDGLYSPSPGTIIFSSSLVARWYIQGTRFRSYSSSGPELFVSGIGLPQILPHALDENSGDGYFGEDSLATFCGGETIFEYYNSPNTGITSLTTHGNLASARRDTVTSDTTIILDNNTIYYIEPDLLSLDIDSISVESKIPDNGYFTLIISGGVKIEVGKNIYLAAGDTSFTSASLTPVMFTRLGDNFYQYAGGGAQELLATESPNGGYCATFYYKNGINNDTTIVISNDNIWHTIVVFDTIGCDTTGFTCVGDSVFSLNELGPVDIRIDFNISLRTLSSFRRMTRIGMFRNDTLMAFTQAHSDFAYATQLSTFALPCNVTSSDEFKFKIMNEETTEDYRIYTTNAGFCQR